MGPKLCLRLALLLGGLVACGAKPPPNTVPAAQVAGSVAAPSAPAATVHRGRPSEPVADARHLLNRLAFGARPGEIERVSLMGPERWLEAQLAGPEQSPLLEPLIFPHRDALAPPAELVARWLGENWEEAGYSTEQFRRELKPFLREYESTLALIELLRHIVSERQVEEVMVDFWTNHFNIYFNKGDVRLFAGDYVERAIRPHALGRFSDLVLATVRHPAMLLYLDNTENAAPEKPGRRARGLNENYARELLELHTLGVDGGYTQDDVIAVARILTGHGVSRIATGQLEYVFRRKRHDFGEKVVLGVRFPEGGGEEEVTRLVELLSEHPSTARHIARKLCARLVADTPPPACIDAAARAFVTTKGDVKAILRAIVTHPSFWAQEVRGQKLKTPVELLASTARALGAVPDGSKRLARGLAELGEAVLGESVPTGYPEAAPEWASSGGMLARFNFAVEVASGKYRGLRYDLDALLPRSVSNEELIQRVNQLLLAGTASEKTLEVVREALEREVDPKARRRTCLALFLASPEFQRQ